MRLPALSVLLLVAPLAGCLADNPEPGDDVVVITDPSDFSYVNNTTQRGSHLHDYWNGAAQLFVLEADNGGSSYGTSGQITIGSYRPPPGNLIPLGTAEVHVTPTFTGPGTADDDGVDVADRHAPIELWVKTAADTEPAFFAQLVDDEIVVFPVHDNSQNDIPHQTLSAWRFDAVMKPREGETLAQWRGSTLELNVTAHRGLPLPLFPPHPDPWQDNDTILVADHTDTFDRHHQTPFTGYSGSQYYPIPSVDGGIVPYDARRVEVALTFEPSGDNMNAEAALRYHDGSTRELTIAKPVREEGDTKYYVLPVDGDGDSPYALQTVWEFLLHSQPDQAAGDVAHPSYRLAGTYQMIVTAHRA